MRVGFQRGHRTRKWSALLTATALAGAIAGVTAPSFADNPAPFCDFFQVINKVSTNSCTPPLTSGTGNNSTFEAGDGNLVPNAAGHHDWSNVGISCPATAGSGTGCGVDPLNGSTDNSFGQGTKEDDPNVTIVTGSIPPNKSDLTRFYESFETIGTGATAQTYLDLAWERSNVLGNANFDFEINKVATEGFTAATTGKITINRSPGDLLIRYDFQNGGGKPTLTLDTWVTGPNTPTPPGQTPNTCFSAKSFPCWGNDLALAASISQGAVNTDTVNDPITGGNACPASGCPALTFGEAAINLTGAGIFSNTTCNTFSSVFVRSRASSSFTAEVKDFVAPVPIHLSNCGQVTIIKHTDPAGINQDFSFTSDVTGTTTAVSSSSACPTGSYTLNASATDTNDCFNVLQGTYTVTEGSEPSGFASKSVTCVTASATDGSSGTVNGVVSTIVVTPDSHVTCTYVNKQQLGALKIIKQSIKLTNGVHARLKDAEFEITGPGGYDVTKSTDANGVICVDGLTAIDADYSITETTAPAGYALDTTGPHTVHVTASNATCADNPFGGQTFTLDDKPLTDLVITATSQDSGPGGTNSTITCTNDVGGANVGNSPQGPTNPAEVDANGLVPGNYTCKVFIDP
jgi:hypothetical protein